jgi:hypothetical protein
VFITAVNTARYLDYFFKAEPDTYVSYGFLKAELETYIQATGGNSSLKLHEEDFIRELLLRGYEVGKFTYNLYQVDINGQEYKRLKAVNRPVAVHGISMSDQDIMWCKRYFIEVGDNPMYVDQHGLKMAFWAGNERIVMGFENKKLTIRLAA